MKFKPGDTVVVTKVPERAAMFVAVGMAAVIQELEHPEHAAYCEDVGLTLIRLSTGFTFWWAEDDLGLHQ